MKKIRKEILPGGSAGDSEVSLFSDNSDMSKWNGFCMAPGSLDWYYYKNGKVQTGLNDVISGTVNGERAWWHVVKGKVVFDNTVAKNSNGWWRIRNGKVDFNFNGLAQNSNGWWYCQGGKVDFNFTGFALRNGIWFYCKNEKFNLLMMLSAVPSTGNRVGGILSMVRSSLTIRWRRTVTAGGTFRTERLILILIQ